MFWNSMGCVFRGGGIPPPFVPVVFQWGEVGVRRGALSIGGGAVDTFCGPATTAAPQKGKA